MALTRPKYSSILDTDFKVSCKVATTGSDIALTGGAPSSLDSEPLSVGDRVLVRDQSLSWQNGIYVVSVVGTGSNGTWVRARDFAASNNVTSGIMIPVTQGTTRGGRIYLLTTPDPITLGATNLTFTDVTFAAANTVNITNSAAAISTITGALTVAGGAGITGNIYAGGNANITGIANVTGNVVGGNLTTGGVLSVTGNANVGNLGTATAIITTGNITTVNSGLMQNGNSNIAITANGNITFTATSNATMVVTSTGANISGTANITGASDIGGNLTVAGNLIVNGTTTTLNTSTLDVEDLNITVAKGAINAAAANGAGLTVDGAIATWLYNSSSNTWVSNVCANITGTINVTGNANVGNLGTTDLVVTGVSNLNAIGNVKITGGSSNQFIQTDGLGNLSFVTLSPSSIFNGNSNVSVAANSNVTVSVAGNANVVTVTGTGANVAGTFDVAGNANTGNLGTGTIIATTANLTTINSGLLQNGNSNVGIVANSNVTVSVAGNANIVTVTDVGANIAGTLGVTGNANVGNLGAGQIVPTTIYANGTVGSAGQFLSSTGTGLDWVTLSANSISNGNSNVRVAANGNVTVSAIGNANVFTVTGTGANVAGTLDVTGNVTVANITANATVNLGNIANVKILGGANNLYIKTDGTGNLSFSGSAGGISFTASATAPVSPSEGDQWYDTANDIFFTYINDGVSSYWFDLSSVPPYPTFTSSTTAPGTPTDGDYWYDTDAGVLYFRINDGTSSLWLDISSAPRVPISTASSTAPTTPTPEPGDFWWDTVDEVLYVRAGAPGSDFWLDISSQPNTFSAITTVNANVTGNLIVTGPTVSQNIIPSANATYTLGNSTNRYSNIWGLASSAQYADLAERYLADNPYDPGTVVVFGGSAEITVTVRDHDHRIAGVVSTDPAYLMNDSADKGNLWLPIALQGRVPTRVIGPVRKGDLLVSSSEPGVARRMSKALYEPGCVIGKSLEDHDEETVKVIEVVAGRI